MAFGALQYYSSYFEGAYTQSDIVTIGFDREWRNAAPSACKLPF
jgi:hypothetical protein